MDKSKQNQREEELPPFVGATKYIPKDCRPDQRYAYRNGAAKLSGSIVKELSKKPEVFRNLENFQPKGGLQQRQIVCGPSGISVEFSSPLQGISHQNYIQTHKRPDLVNDNIQKENDDEDDSIGGKFKKGISTVIAVDCKWKNGIKLTNAVSGSRSREINPNLKKIDFDFESKMKFAKEMEQICEEYFPQDNVLILEGNKSHGKYSLHQPKETEVALEPPFNPRLPYDKQDKVRPGTTVIDPYDVVNTDYNDLEEHKILLVPTFSKSGFEVDTTQRYRFPYTAKFLIDSRRYERSFELQLPLSESPQHFGLVFAFPEKQAKSTSAQQTNIVIKSMISVYTVFPHSARHSSLTVYEFPDLPKTGQHPRKGGSNSTYTQKGPQTQARLIAKDYLANMKDNLKEEKLVPRRREQFVVNYDIKGKDLVKEKFTHPTNKFIRQYPTNPDVKHKRKEDITTKIRVESRE